MGRSCWQMHTERKLHLYRLRRCGLPHDVLKMYTNSCLYPAITYAAPVFHYGLNKGDREEFRKIDRKITRAIAEELPSFHHRCDSAATRYFDKEVKAGRIEINYQKHGYNLRTSKNQKRSLIIPRTRTKTYKNSFKVASLYSYQSREADSK